MDSSNSEDNVIFNIDLSISPVNTTRFHSSSISTIQTCDSNSEPDYLENNNFSTSVNSENNFLDSSFSNTIELEQQCMFSRSNDSTIICDIPTQQSNRTFRRRNAIYGLSSSLREYLLSLYS